MGLLRGVWAQVTQTPLQPVPAYTPDWSEAQGDERLWSEVSKRLTRKQLGDAAPGDVVLFRMRQGAVAKHVGLQAACGDTPTFIHAYQGHGVVENAFSAPWQRRMVARFAAPVFELKEV